MSLYQQILKNSNTVLHEQTRKYKLSDKHLFTDPIMAADYLLQREYADTALFDDNRHSPIFIPDEFQSIQYAKKDSSTHILDYDIERILKKTLGNLLIESPNDWLTKEMLAFCNLQENIPCDKINAKEFSDWILKLKIMYLVIEELGPDKVTLPKTTSATFFEACINELTVMLPTSHLIAVLRKVSEI